MKYLAKISLLLLLLLVFLAPAAYSQDNNQAGIKKTEHKCEQAQFDFYAQLDEEPPMDMPFPHDDQKFDQSKRKYLEQLRILKLLELLNLDEEQDMEFIRLYHNHRKIVQQVDGEHLVVVKKLSDGLKNDNISEEVILRLTSEILNKTEERSNLDKSFLYDSKKILTPKQYGKLVVFQERFERELLEQVRQFRSQGKYGHGQGRGFDIEKQKPSDIDKK